MALEPKHYSCVNLKLCRSKLCEAQALQEQVNCVRPVFLGGRGKSRGVPCKENHDQNMYNYCTWGKCEFCPYLGGWIV